MLTYKRRVGESVLINGTEVRIKRITGRSVQLLFTDPRDNRGPARIDRLEHAAAVPELRHLHGLDPQPQPAEACCDVNPHGLAAG